MEPPLAPAIAKKAPPKAQVRPSAEVKAINLTEFFQLQQADRALVFDARPAFVHAFGHVPSAISWPRGSFDSGLPRHEARIRSCLAEGRTIVIYCTDAACPDAGAVAERLAKLGYPVSVLDGGFAAWKEAGLPTE